MHKCMPPQDFPLACRMSYNHSAEGIRQVLFSIGRRKPGQRAKFSNLRSMSSRRRVQSIWKRASSCTRLLTPYRQCDTPRPEKFVQQGSQVFGVCRRERRRGRAVSAYTPPLPRRRTTHSFIRACLAVLSHSAFLDSSLASRYSNKWSTCRPSSPSLWPFATGTDSPAMRKLAYRAYLNKDRMA